MNADQIARRISILVARLDNLSPTAPLRVGAGVVAELRSLGWGRK